MQVEDLKWKKFLVLNDGFVCLVDVMGDDSSVVQAARVSYGEGTKHVSDDRTLIRYLMRHRHSTPFEMAEIKLLVRVPMDCWRQWIRHRTANVNEYSTRYSEAIDSQQKTDPGEWRLQSTTNKQGSEGGSLVWGDNLTDLTGNVAAPYSDQDGSGYNSVGEFLSVQENELQIMSRDVYETRLACGVAREQARKDLPLSTYTEAYWKIDLHNLLHFLSLRMDSHAQKEIRDYATIIGEQIAKPLFPLVWEAFEDYRLNGLFLTRLDQEVIQKLTEWVTSPDGEIQKQVGMFPQSLDESSFSNEKSKFWINSELWPNAWRGLKSCRERDECVVKLTRLGLVVKNGG